MVTQAPRRSSVAIALAFSLSCIGLIIFVWIQFAGTIPFAPQGYRVHARFQESGLLVPGADVRIAGVNVGRVTAVTAVGTSSEVTLNIDQQYAPLPTDTRAILRQKTLLGEAFVALSTGNGAGPKIRDGGSIPSSQVVPYQQLDHVLDSFTPAVQHDLQAFLAGTGSALAGRSQDLNDWFGNLDPTVTELAAVVGELNQEQGDLKGLIRNSGSVLTTLGSRSTELQSLINAGNTVFAATADQSRAITRTIDAFPPFLRRLKTTLADVNVTLGLAGPSLAAINPVAPLITPALRGLVNLSGPVVSLLGAAPATLRTARAVLPDITAFVGQLEPAVDAIFPAAQQIVPIINIVADNRDELVNGFANLAADTQGQTSANTTTDVGGIAAGQAKYVRGLATIGSDSVFGETVRSPGERSNAYMSPGELNDLADGGLLSASCANVNNTAQVPAADSNVSCRLQPSFSWGHGVGSSFYPHVGQSAKSGR